MRLLLLALTLAAATGNVLADDSDASIDLRKMDARIKSSDRAHWAFQPLRKPSVPKVKDAEWVRNPIDAFVLEKLEAKGWKPSPAAAPHVLLRRMHYDLIGLPPTLPEQEHFAAGKLSLDDLAGDLLGRVTYGERWARHWLDVVRFAESSGYERDAAKPSAWRYRDYVIRAFNDDKPFDRFVLEQIAGDELPDANAETLVAVGMHRLGPWDDEPADPLEDRFDQLDDIVSTNSLAFLGLTMGCARCHHHKFEALTQLDYYRMAAIFAPLERPRNGRTELDSPIGTHQELGRQTERDRKIELLRKEIATRPTEKSALEAEIEKLRRGTPDLPRGYLLREGAAAPKMHLLIRGKASRPGPEVKPGLPTVLVSTQPKFPEPAKTSLQRLTLAKWIANAENPLPARVIVNRVWHYHFGQGIVRTPNDFGTVGQPPTHPELLDWLASWFIENGWSIKKLHRLIMQSSTYRMQSASDSHKARSDPDNRLLWRFPYRRLEAEAIRDGILAVSGELNPKSFGPSMHPPIAKEALAGNSDLERIWKASDRKEASRRSIYIFVKRALVVPMLETFDLCDTTRSIEKRLVTTVAPQALQLFNGEFMQEQSRHFAARLVREAPNDLERQIDIAYRLAFARSPLPQESATMREFIQKGESQSERNRLLTEMCRVIFNLNEFVYPD